ncbi:MAG: hypothetical protein UIG59_00605 [Acutalibacteraceae bacterium]|nr:hypothetical protein [Acutalibacteraceae bacterium]
MRTKKQLPAADEIATLAAQSKTKIGAKPSQMLRSCRLQFQNPATFEVTSIYLTRTDARRYRVKIFKGGKCQMAQYVEGDDFLEVLQKVNDYIN